MRRLYESIVTRGGEREHHTGCDLRDDAVLDAVCFLGGIFVVARTARAGLDQIHHNPCDEP
jgi:hypothetical protein